MRTYDRGPKHYNWGNFTASSKWPQVGRKRAQRRFPLGACERCGKPATDRHHKDENTFNNAPENIEMLCRACHMAVDGRQARLIARNKAPKPEIPPKPCTRCGRLYKPLRRGLCSRCYERDRSRRRRAK